MSRVRLARTTRKPRKRAPKGTSILRRLTEAETREQLRLTEQQRDVLDRIAAGRPPRNALAILKAIDLKLAYTQPKPAQKVHLGGEGGGPVKQELEVRFVEPSGEEPPGGDPTAS